MLRATTLATSQLLPRPWASRCLWALPVAPRRRHTQAQPQQQAAAAAAAGEVGDPQPAGSAHPQAAHAEPPPKPRQSFHFCRMCGGAVELVLPEGDSLWRHRCTRCSTIDYQNPRMVVGCIIQHEGRILLCRRGIEPQRGLWTVPAGYLECGESSAEGAARETWEEAGARVAIDAPFCHLDIPGIAQVYLLFRARLAPPFTFAAQQPESLEAALFAPHEIPFDELAFSSVAIALRSYVADLERGTFNVHHGSFQLVGHMAIPTPLRSR